MARELRVAVMQFVLGLLVGFALGAGAVGAFVGARAAHALARKAAEQLRDLHW